jgi:hypothetical protein
VPGHAELSRRHAADPGGATTTRSHNP